MRDCLADLAALREAYNAICRALPWLDASAWEHERPAFESHAKPLSTAHARAVSAGDAYAGRIAEIQERMGVDLLRFDPSRCGPVDRLDPLFPEMAAQRMPLVVLHTDLGFEEIGALAEKHPDLAIIVESGPRKLLYHYAQVLDLLRNHPNCHLSTHNFDNWQGIEEFVTLGLGDRLLYGTHGPAVSPDVAMGPIAMGRLSWEQKCAVAGNNLRRLLGQSPETPAEVPFSPPPPFIIDAHTHSIDFGVEPPFGFHTPDTDMRPSDWTAFMDAVALDALILMPGESLKDADRTCAHYCEALRRQAPERFFYLEVFHPNVGADHEERVAQSLNDPACLGIKIHPTGAEIPADDDAFAPAYRLAAAADKVVMSHTWEISSYNPKQYLSHPDRFRPHLERHPDLRFVFGHAGGRPSTIDAVTRLTAEFPNAYVDVAGDYYDNGLVDCLADRLGANRVLYASDMDWMDPRCNMALVLGSNLSDQNMLQVLRENALRVYRPSNAPVPQG